MGNVDAGVPSEEAYRLEGEASGLNRHDWKVFWPHNVRQAEAMPQDGVTASFYTAVLHHQNWPAHISKSMVVFVTTWSDIRFHDPATLATLATT